MADPPSDGRWFEAVAAHTGDAYLRYSFTKGTDQEVDFLWDVLAQQPGQRLLDVGCGPGRHSRAFAERGLSVVGLDIATPFLAAAGPGQWVRGDARRLPFPHCSFDTVISLCQGGFGLLGGIDDAAAFDELARVTRPGGHVVVSAFSAYFAVRHLEAGDTFDAGRGVNHEQATVRNSAGLEADFDLWTTCFTPRELRLLGAAAGLTVDALWSVGPGRYGARPPDLEHPEWLMMARKS